jgi:hypothetical protein
LHYSKANGGHHEYQDKLEGWTAHSNPLKRRETEELPNPKGKEDAMKTKSNVKAGLRIATL